MLSAKLAAILSTGRWVKSVPVLRSGSLPCLPLHKYSWWSRLDLMYHITQGRGTGTVFICCAAVWSQFSRNACHSSTYDIHQGAPTPPPTRLALRSHTPHTKQRIHCDGCSFNILRPRQNYRHFADDIFRCIFLNENEWILLKISLKFIPRVPINNIPALVQIMAWCRPGAKPLSGPMMVSLVTHICETRPQWVNTCRDNVAAS